MKKNILLVFVLFSLYAKSQVSYRNLIIDASVITELNEPLTSAIDRHIEVSKVKKRNNKNDFFILISVYSGISQWQIPKHIYDSIYAVNNFKTVFPTDTVLPLYTLSIVLASKKYYTGGWINFNRKNVYYCNYNNYEVLINSELSLIFESKNQTKQIEQKLIILPNKETDSPYKIWTRYSMWNNKYLTEIRYKDLIFPTWTGKRDEFE
jgi:hypothetical protein